MKSLKIFAASLSVLLMAVFAACNPLPPLPPDDSNDTIPGDQPGIEDVIPEGVDIPEGAITVAEARAICAALESGATTGTKYYVKGWVKKLHNKHTQETIDQYGNGQFFMVDKIGDSDDFLAYQVYGLNGQKLVSVDQVEVGDYVVIYGELTNYNGTYETVGKGAAYIYSSSNPKIGENTIPQNPDTPDPEDVVGDGSREHPYSVADIIALNNAKAGNYWVKAVIVGQVKGGATSMSDNTVEFAAPFTGNDNGTNTNILVAAAAGETELANIVPVQLPAGSLRDGLNLVQNGGLLGQEVLLYGSLEKYFGAAGVKSPTYAEVGETKLGKDPEDNTPVVEPTATVATVAEFIAAPVDPTVYFELTGTIGGSINTTYGNFDLTDATGTVYVYGLTASYIPMNGSSATNDKSYASLGLKEGDNVTIRGTRGVYGEKVEVLGAYFVRKN